MYADYVFCLQSYPRCDPQDHTMRRHACWSIWNRWTEDVVWWICGNRRVATPHHSSPRFSRGQWCARTVFFFVILLRKCSVGQRKIQVLELSYTLFSCSLGTSDDAGKPGVLAFYSYFNTWALWQLLVMGVHAAHLLRSRWNAEEILFVLYWWWKNCRQRNQVNRANGGTFECPVPQGERFVQHGSNAWTC